MCLGPKCGIRANFFKIGQFLDELWSKNLQKWVKFYVMAIFLIFSGFLAITQPKINQFWRNWNLFHILDQDTIFLSYKFFRLITAKNAFLSNTRNFVLIFFSKYLISIRFLMRHLAVVLVYLVHFFSVGRAWGTQCYQ